MTLKDMTRGAQLYDDLRTVRPYVVVRSIAGIRRKVVSHAPLSERVSASASPEILRPPILASTRCDQRLKKKFAWGHVCRQGCADRERRPAIHIGKGAGHTSPAQDVNRLQP